jgi:hypothetical protein
MGLCWQQGASKINSDHWIVSGDVEWLKRMSRSIR